jgi:hypothetical protein
MPFNELIDNRCHNNNDDDMIIIMKMIMDHQDNNKIPGVVVIINDNGEAMTMMTTLVDRIVLETLNPRVAAVIIIVIAIVKAI